MGAVDAGWRIVNAYLYLVQRLSALIMAPLVLVHLGLIIYAVNDGLSAGEILGRTQGSVGWTLFYFVFVIAAVIHAAIGLRNVLTEWLALPRRAADIVMFVAACGLLTAGLRAVYAVTNA
jgi:fumarate reductase subunit C